MKTALLCSFFLLINCNVIAQLLDLNQLDIRYLMDVQKLFCVKSEQCFHMSHSTSNSQSKLLLESGTTTMPALSDIGSGLPVMPPEIPGYRCCGQCSCDVNTCDVTDSCCLEAFESLRSKNNSNVRMTCDYPQLRPFDIAYPNVERPKLMFRECPKVGNSHTDTVNKCDNSKNYKEIYTNIPVTEATTMYIYKNRYCAYCHNVTEADLHYWDASLECLHGILKPQNISSIVAEILATDHCNLKYTRPSSLGSGSPSYDCRIVISKCNVTGHWKKYDPVIEAGCLAYSTMYSFKYRNVFCYLCNTNDTSGPTYCSDIARPTILVDFKALLKFQPDVNTVPNSNIQDECSVNQIYDPLTKRCRDIECLFPKTVKNGRCVNLVENLGGVTYGIFLKMTPSEDINVSNRSGSFDIAEDIKEVIISWLKVRLQNTDLVSLYIYNKVYKSDVFDSTDYTIAYLVVYVEIAFGLRSPVNSDVIDYMLAIQDTYLDTRNISQNGTGVKYKVEIDKYDIGDVGAPQIFDASSGELNVTLIYGIEINYPKTVLSILHMCPLVRIKSNDFNIVRLSHSIYIQELNTTIDEKKVLIENVNGSKVFSVRMCTHMFEELMKPFAETGKQLERINKCVTKTLSTSAILSPVCTSISLTFSVLTLIIYLRFKELKTQPGINNIVLCIALIIAQTLFQFGSGQACNVSKEACQIIGILVHFSWLFLIFWMNSCCIHMFRVFRLNRTRMALFNTIKTTVVYILYSFIAALIFVLINVSVSLQGSAGHDIGYGGSMCYINKDYMVAYLFALPVAVIVFINIIVFIIVMFQMKMSPKVQNDKNERNLLYIYARLSTLTGSTWIFGFFSYFFNVVALDVIFIILNATQGIFLFIAFVANRRTLSLLRKNEHKQTLKNTSKTQTYSNDRGTNTGNETILSTRSVHYIQSN